MADSNPPRIAPDDKPKETLGVRIHAGNRELLRTQHFLLQQRRQEPKLKESDVARLAFYLGQLALARQLGTPEPVNDLGDLVTRPTTKGRKL